MSSQGLDLDTITQLLKEDKEKPKPQAGKSSSKSSTPHEPPIQIGPLRYGFEATQHCSSKGCRVPCAIKIRGVPYCNTHALYELNRIWLMENGYDWVIAECNCNAGKYSYQCCHGEECAVYGRLKEQRESDTSSGGKESLPGEL